MTLLSESPTPAPLTAGNVHYDPLSYAAYDHSYGINRQRHDRVPVYCNERRDPWVVSRYDEVKACLRKDLALSLREMWA